MEIPKVESSGNEEKYWHIIIPDNIVKKENKTPDEKYELVSKLK